MKFLIDTKTSEVNRKLASHPTLVCGQLLTPLTRYAYWGGEYAIDNGAFSGLKVREFTSLLRRQSNNRDRCLFVTCPDIVGSARRTLELWERRDEWCFGWDAAFVAQDGLEDLPIPWDEFQTIFIGGDDPWKDSKAAMDIVLAAKALGKHVHVGRVNTAKRYKAFLNTGADTCDGSGVARYDHMLIDIAKALSTPEQPKLFDWKHA